MAYQVLARKYRPQRFSDVAGQDHVTRTLLNALSLGRTAHGYIFSGHRGIGKTTIARILAMALNCRTEIGSPQRPTPEPCGICVSCTEIRAGNAVDVIEIDAATNRGIDEIRELRDAARYRPARDRYKIYILDEAHQITDAAFNALLKTLEEPPDHVVFMMATTQPEDIPQTIRSRCQHFSFHAVKFDDILSELREIAAKESIDAEDAALALLAEAGDGSMRDALSIMDQAIASAAMVDGKPRLDAEQIRELMGAVPNAVFERLMEAISEGQTAALIDELNRLLNAGNSPSQLARQFVRYLRNVLMARLAGENSELLQISPDERARAARSALLFSEEDLTRFLQIMLRTFDDLNYRQEQRFHLELGLIKLVHLQRLLPVEELLSRLPAASSDKPASGAASAPGGRLASSSAGNPAAPAASRAASPQQPAESPFSPFEADRNRKMSGAAAPESSSAGIRSSTPGGAAAPAPVPAPASVAAPAPRALTPLESAARAVEAGAAVNPGNSVNSGTINPATRKGPAAGAVAAQVEATEGSLALAADADSSMSGSPDADSGIEEIKQAVVAALQAEGHATAAVLLADGRWREAESAIEVEVRAKKTMLSLTMNPDADRIAKNALRTFGMGRKIVWISSDAGANKEAPAAAPRAAVVGGVHAAALDNPLVKQAQELFRADVRSVLDLRNKNLQEKD